MIQYYHSINDCYEDDCTIAVDLPSKSVFNSLIPYEKVQTIGIYCGFSKVHPKDRYVKSIGRELSSSRLQLQFFDLKAVNYYEDHVILYLVGKEINDIGHLRIRISEKSDRPHLLASSLIK